MNVICTSVIAGQYCKIYKHSFGMCFFPMTLTLAGCVSGGVRHLLLPNTGSWHVLAFECACGVTRCGLGSSLPVCCPFAAHLMGVAHVVGGSSIWSTICLYLFYDMIKLVVWYITQIFSFLRAFGSTVYGLGASLPACCARCSPL